MLFIRTLLSPRSKSTQEAHVSSLLSQTDVAGSGELHKEASQYLMAALNSSLAPEKFMRALFGQLQELNLPE
jgi:hypothetical protein